MTDVLGVNRLLDVGGLLGVLLAAAGCTSAGQPGVPGWTEPVPWQ